MSRILYAIFFLSGAAALLFETLWFRQAGLAFGNSVWASSLVLSSFMAGLALGNGLAARHGAGVRRPLRVYALLEVAIAVLGVALIWAFPVLTGWLTLLLRPFLEWPWILNPLRFLAGFLLLLLPATAMGATLPILVKALRASDSSFGSVLGRLYGVNTLGAVVGALVGETLLIEWCGVRGTGALAGAVSLLVAGVALVLANRLTPAAVARDAPRAGFVPLSALAGCFLAAAFLSGAILLALEVVWFRFLHLFVHGGSLAFALMLGTVLAGIGLGGLMAGWWLRRDPGAFRHGCTLALAAGCVSVLIYYGFGIAIAPFATQYVRDPRDILWLTWALTFPSSFLSGMLFTVIGAALNQEVQRETQAAGLVTLANTIGGGLGSVAAGFVLLPLAGMESSFFLLASLYGIVALLLLGSRPRDASPARAMARYPAVILFALAIVFFPFGLMEGGYLQLLVRRQGDSARFEVVAIREGVIETIIYLRKHLFGEPVSYTLLTDGFSMAGTGEWARRYMKLFVYWPVALRPNPQRALLISYGVGVTAKALTDTPSLEHIDIVDVSREILEMSDIVYPDPAADPLRDSRIHVHVEDGRYFLQTTKNRYDLITGEPPPPKIARVVNLYTREYFQLVYDRLTEGGVNTYWLPVHNLTESDVKTVVRAYCDVFEDCSLWAGLRFDWMLVGSRNARYAPSHAEFARQWEDSRAGPELRAVGLERPEQIGALFLADAPYLREFTRGTPPLVDDFPKRLADEFVEDDRIDETYAELLDTEASRERFRRSEFIRSAWPETMRESSLECFAYERIIREASGMRWSSGSIEKLHALLTESSLQTVVLWLLGTGGDELRAVDRLLARGDSPDRHFGRLGVRALAERDFALASDYLGREMAASPRNRPLLELQLYALCMADRCDEAERLARTALDWVPRDDRDRRYREWMQEAFGLGAPGG
jgi:predicted membrane-bound spermidine synthase